MIVSDRRAAERGACRFEGRRGVPGAIEFDKRRAYVKALVGILHGFKKCGHVLFEALPALRNQQGGNRRSVAHMSSIAEEFVAERWHAVGREIQDQFDEVQIEI